MAMMITCTITGMEIVEVEAMTIFPEPPQALMAVLAPPGGSHRGGARGGRRGPQGRLRRGAGVKPVG